jgi:hypothetical protein
MILKAITHQEGVRAISWFILAFTIVALLGAAFQLPRP